MRQGRQEGVEYQTVKPIGGVIGALLIASPATAHSLEAYTDEIVVTTNANAVNAGEETPPLSTIAIDASALEAVRAIDLNEAALFIPSASVTTNSRGETLLSLRGAGERQTGLFFNGAPLNIPWDNRLDLSLVPATALSNVTVRQGVASVLFGGDAAGGAIEIAPATALGDATGPIGESRAPFAARGAIQGGGLGFFDGEALVAGGARRVRGVFAGGVTRRDALAAPDASDLLSKRNASPPPADGGQPNTDRQRTNFLAHLSTERSSDLRLSAAVLGVRSSFGIAPETTFNPADENPRFWRFPDTEHVIGVVNASIPVSPQWDVTATGWGQAFNQTIESFASNAFLTLEDIQRDRDRAFGARISTERQWGGSGVGGGVGGGVRHEVRGVFSFLDARHDQDDIAFSGAGTPPLVTAFETAFFQRRTFGLGGAYEGWFGDTGARLSAAGDIVSIPASGGRASAGGFAGWNIAAALNHRLSPSWTIEATAARRARLPTQRELFGDAINRFVLNPDLQAEQSIQLEGVLRFETPRASVTATPFAVITTGTIDQEVLPGTGGQRRRINLDGARSLGVAVAAEARPFDGLSLGGNVTVQRVRRRGAGDGPRVIAERPDTLAAFYLSYRHRTGLGVYGGGRYRGRAFSLADTGVFVPLARSIAFDAEVSYAFSLYGTQTEVFVRGDNLANTFVEPQLGLPEAGRRVRAGLRVAIGRAPI